jgi:hypothetical protein
MAIERDPLQVHSWKEIAAYMGRSIRTVQRMEKFGLPVRRITTSVKASVSADSRDIDIWLASARAHGVANAQSAEQIFLRGSLKEALSMSRALRKEMVKLREERRQDMIVLKDLVQQLKRTMAATEGPWAERRQTTSKYEN